MRILVAGLVLGYVCGAAKAQDFGGAVKVPAPQTAQMVAANEALAARDYARAVKLLTPLAEQNPKDAHVLYDLGSAQDALDQSTAAEQSYRAAIADDANYLEPRAALGLLLARAGRMDDARTELIGAASVETDDKPLRARVLRALARIDQRSRPGVARDELLAALQISPETPEDTLMAAELAGAAGNGKPAAEAAYRKVLANLPNDPEATAALGHLLVEEKRYADAEKLLSDALAVHPGDEPMTIQLAAAYTAEGKTAEALPLVEKLHAANPREMNVTHLLAGLYIDAKDYARAEPLLNVLVTHNPKDGGAAELDGEALVQLKRYADAERVLTEAVADPGNFSSKDDWGQAAFELAYSASENNHPGLVLQVLGNRAKVLPSSPSVLFLTAISEDKLHRIKEAEQAYKDFLAASNGALPDEEFEARHRLIALQRSR